MAPEITAVSYPNSSPPNAATLVNRTRYNHPDAPRLRQLLVSIE